MQQKPAQHQSTEHVTTAQRPSIGFGMYRTVDGNAEHEAALRHALAQGVPLLDTSSNYGNGRSEALAGRVLHEPSVVIGAAHVSSPEVITKLGYVQGSALQMARDAQAAGEPYPDMVQMSDSLWHCIHPEYLADAFAQSRARLQLADNEPIAALLLHNPEYFLAHAHQTGVDLDAARATFYDRLRLAFEWMESLLARGQIRGYGISSNTFAHEVDAPDFISLERCHEIAPGMTFAQVPFNLIEHHAATVLNQSDKSMTMLEYAHANGIRALTNRPLNAIGGEELIRLVTYEMPAHIVHPQDVEARIHALEIEEHDVAQLVLMDTTLGEQERAAVQETFKIAAALCQSWNKFNGIPHWRDIREAYLAPRLNAAERLVQRSSDPQRVQAYIHDTAALLNDVEWMYAAEENASLDELRLAMTDEFGLPVDTPLQHIAIHCLVNTPGVDTVLVGMRSKDYVDDVLAALELPPSPIHRPTWLRVSEHLHRLSE